MPALWETETEIGRRLMEAWRDEGSSVFIVTRSFEVYQELEKLNSESTCRWLSVSAPSENDDAKSISTIQEDSTAPDIGVLCLGTPQFSEHLKERHSIHNLGPKLFMSLPKQYYIQKPIQFNISFPVPYFSRHGLVNLEYLRNLASEGFHSDMLKPLLPHCFEVRGFPEARGVYISVVHLDAIVERLGLRVEDEYDFDAADTSLDEYTYQGWYLLAPNPSSRLFPVKRTTNQVLTLPLPSPLATYTPLRTLLEDHFEAKTFLDSQVVHDAEKLFAAAETAEPGGGCCCRTPAADRLLLEIKEKRRADETSAWIREQEEDRRVRRRSRGRRRGGMDNRADITPTEFGTGAAGASVDRDAWE
ncbi:hypothetical protein C8A00DRAFT_38930 [Chaetomidium leptoderma]|uniref:Uncharacterized protein n=1 Tax=Chaetomidium leptoderma TaxID=669021 RepID=A0AAN6ZSJ5_9PEZI|nr:hypothetical protein C8A00DRAFT_38930 [Chaetomidium leptoderma]